MKLHHWMWRRNYKMQKCFMSADAGKYRMFINPEQNWRGLFWTVWITYQNFCMTISNMSHSSETRRWEVCVRDGNCSERSLLCCGNMLICKPTRDSKGPGNIALMSIFWHFSPKHRDSDGTETLDLTKPCWVTQWSLEAVFQLLHTVQLPQVVCLQSVLLRKAQKVLRGNAVS